MTGSPRVWLVGEQNPYGADPTFALYPLPEHASGGRLARILGLTAGEYLAAFERRNLLAGSRWSDAEASVAARLLVAEAELADAFVLLGARVTRAFELGPFARTVFGSWKLPTGQTAVVLPHPSGRNRVWNEVGSRARARRALAVVRGVSA